MTYFLQVSAVLVAASVCLRLLRVRDPEIRLRTLQAALILCVLLPFAPPALPKLRIDAAADGLAALGPAASAMTRAADSRIPWPWIWGAGAAALLGRFALGLFALRSLRNASRPFAMRAGGVPILLSDSIASPVAFGRTVLLPAQASGEPRELIEPMIAHELEHIARRDWWSVVAEEAVRAALWFHPAAWWTLARVRAAREQAVDVAVASRHGAEVYSESLLAAAEWRAVGAHLSQPFPATAMYSGGALGRRLQLIQNPKETHMTRMHRAAAISALTFASAAVFTLAASAAPAFASQQEEEVKPKVIKKVTPAYPREAKDARVQGEVAMKVTLGKDGHVLNVEVAEGPVELREAAVKAVKEWEFEPGTKGGKPVEVEFTITMNFTLAP